MFPEFCACKRAQSCPTLYNPIDCSTTGSSVHGNFLARILEWVAISFSLYKHKNSKSHKNDLSSFYILYAYICVCVCMFYFKIYNLGLVFESINSATRNLYSEMYKAKFVLLHRHYISQIFSWSLESR